MPPSAAPPAQRPEPPLSVPIRLTLPTPAPPLPPRSKPPSPLRRSCAWCQRVRIWLGLGGRPVIR